MFSLPSNFKQNVDYLVLAYCNAISAECRKISDLVCNFHYFSAFIRLSKIPTKMRRNVTDFVKNSPEVCRNPEKLTEAL